MSPTTRIAQALLITHGLMNISQGIYSLVSPQEYAALAGDMFAGAPDKALKSIGNFLGHSGSVLITLLRVKQVSVPLAWAGTSSSLPTSTIEHLYSRRYLCGSCSRVLSRRGEVGLRLRTSL